MTLAAGTIVGTQTSDERLKTGIYDTTYGLDTALNLRPINFEMDEKKQVGFSAQHTILTKAIQELSAKVTALESQLN